MVGLDPADHGTHSLRRTKATRLYRRTKNLRAGQLLLGIATLESTVRYLGVEVEDALEMRSVHPQENGRVLTRAVRRSRVTIAPPAPAPGGPCHPNRAIPLATRLPACGSTAASETGAGSAGAAAT